MRFKLSSKFVRGFFYAPQMSRKKKKRSLKQVSKQNNVKKYRLEICQRLETRILPRIVKFQVQGDQRVANKRRNNRLPVYISGDAFSCFSFTVTARHDDVYDIYIYIYEDPTCHQRERKERKRGDRVGSFRPTGGEALRGSFCHLVVSFYGSSPSSSRIQTKRTAYTKRRFAIDNFPAPVSISFMLFLMSITIGHRPIILPAKICEIIVQLYLLSFSIRVFFLFFRSNEGTMFFLLILIK